MRRIIQAEARPGYTLELIFDDGVRGQVNIKQRLHGPITREGTNMQIKSEDVITLSDLKINPGRVVNRINDTHREILLTSRGRGVAVMQGLEDYEKTAEELRFVKAMAQGLADIRKGNTVSIVEARKILGR
jgi:prevent-host-death family protein